mgnify:CR=1 FL=1
MKNFIKFLFGFIFFSNFILAQNLNVRLIKTDTEKFPYLVSAVQVYDNNEEPIIDLKNSDFSATLGGKVADSVSAVTYKKSGMGINIMLCVDISGTMTGKPMLSMKNAINKFIDDMRPMDKLGIIGIADDAELISDFSNNKEYLKQKVESLTPKGNYSSIFYGAYKGIKALADNKENTGKILMLIADGKNESPSNTYTEKDVIDLGVSEGIPVFSIGYTKIDPAYLQSLEKISDKTNGKFYNSPNDDDLSRQYQKLYNQILNIYLVKYVIYNTKGDGNEYVSSVSVKHDNTVKSDNKKVIIPAGVTGISKESKIIDKPTEWWVYAIIAGVIVIVGVVVFILRKKKLEKEAELLKQKQEEQKKQNEIMEAERKKREDLEKKLEESKNVPYTDEQKAEGTKIVSKIKAGEEKTMIIGATTNTGIGNANLLRLDFTIGVFGGQRYDIDPSGATIGRKEDNSIVLKEGTISGYHAKISFTGGNFYIEDLNSSNGTFINGRKITSTILQHGDVFKFGGNEGNISVF